MVHRRERGDVLPPIDVETGEAESSGLGGTSVDLGPKIWGLIASGCALALVVTLLLGAGGGHGRPAATSPPSTAARAIPALDEQTMRSISFDGGGFAMTMSMGEDTGVRNVAGLDFEGAGLSSHSYFFEVGACPNTSTIASVKATTNPRGEFGAALEVRLRSNPLLWMRVVDDAGVEFAAARGRLYGPELEFVEPSANLCSATPLSQNAVDQPEQLVARRAVLGPPHLFVSVISGADVTQHIEPLASGTREVVLARFEDGETGLVFDPAWVVIDRAPITTVLGTFGTVATSTAVNVVRVFDAQTGDLELTFSGAPGPITCAEPGAPSDVCGHADAQSG